MVLGAIALRALRPWRRAAARLGFSTSSAVELQVSRSRAGSGSLTSGFRPPRTPRTSRVESGAGRTSACPVPSRCQPLRSLCLRRLVVGLAGIFWRCSSAAAPAATGAWPSTWSRCASPRGSCWRCSVGTLRQTPRRTSATPRTWSWRTARWPWAGWLWLSPAPVLDCQPGSPPAPAWRQGPAAAALPRGALRGAPWAAALGARVLRRGDASGLPLLRLAAGRGDARGLGGKGAPCGSGPTIPIVLRFPGNGVPLPPHIWSRCGH